MGKIWLHNNTIEYDVVTGVISSPRFDCKYSKVKVEWVYINKHYRHIQKRVNPEIKVIIQKNTIITTSSVCQQLPPYWAQLL